ncbi:hypothetical protein O3P69_018095 [Scylla paramamosain]|uniref:Uncharacterized protein n=1 Tax=Scylla paramamosain TaxID=85552 RepID=A0AAW0TKN5_SCYPA
MGRDRWGLVEMGGDERVTFHHSPSPSPPPPPPPPSPPQPPPHTCQCSVAWQTHRIKKVNQLLPILRTLYSFTRQCSSTCPTSTLSHCLLHLLFFLHPTSLAAGGQQPRQCLLTTTGGQNAPPLTAASPLQNNTTPITTSSPLQENKTPITASSPLQGNKPSPPQPHCSPTTTGRQDHAAVGHRVCVGRPRLAVSIPQAKSSLVGVSSPPTALVV